MKVIVCLDDRNGMMFNHRRQSRDREVTADIVRSVNGVLWMEKYSESLFLDSALERLISERFLDLAKSEDWCFVEDQCLSGYEDQIETLIIYRWNRHYPADRTFDLDLKRFRLTDRMEFAGFSHEKITKEIFEK